MSEQKPANVVEPDQLWVDNDPRVNPARFIRITSVDATHATCEAWYDEAGSHARTTRIRLSRFRPTVTGYRHATDAERDQQLGGVE